MDAREAITGLVRRAQAYREARAAYGRAAHAVTAYEISSGDCRYTAHGTDLLYDRARTWKEVDRTLRELADYAADDMLPAHTMENLT